MTSKGTSDQQELLKFHSLVAYSLVAQMVKNLPAVLESEPTCSAFVLRSEPRAHQLLRVPPASGVWAEGSPGLLPSA